MQRNAIATLLLAAAFIGLFPQVEAQIRNGKRVELRRAPTDTASLPSGTRVERDIAYGPNPLQRYDVYLPPQRKPGSPLLIMVHGGGWRTGDKGSPGVVGAKAAHWLGQGFVFVSVNNRLLPDADPPEQARDVATAVASVQKKAPQWQADSRRVVLMGHSAGAHLAALVGASPTLLEQAGAQRLSGVVALDSAAMDVPRMMEKPLLPRVYDQAFGKDPQFWVAASPFHQLTRQAVPMLIVCSSRRPDACPQGRALMDKARDLGVPIHVLPQDLSHGEINRDLGKTSAYTRQVEAWIERLLN